MPDDQTQGQRFVLSLIGGLVFLALSYVALHATVREAAPCCPTEPNICTRDEPARAKECSDGAMWTCFARVDEKGVLHFLNASDVDWYVGAERAGAIRKSSNERSARMDELRERLHRTATKIRRRVTSDEEVDAFLWLIEDARYDEATTAFATLAGRLSITSGQELGDDIFDSRQALGELRRLKVVQCGEARQLAPPLARLFFWTSPTWSIFEVFFWAAFGVLTNLLVNSAEYLRKGTFKPAEKWVAYTKLAYGPILAMMLVLAMINGFFQPESFEVRVWTLPLVGFIFGYAARRTANLFDRLTERFLGAAGKGIDAGPEAVRAKRKELVDELMQAYKPRNFEELRDQAKTVSDELVEVALTEMEANR